MLEFLSLAYELVDLQSPFRLLCFSNQFSLEFDLKGVVQ